ncbi:redoxin domain-containing protein [Lacimicrobium sp. SS2-24]|uniref:redoxin domain-containing protein n=1 Tax=Lacimicrobium sp. SS2-24 TaxID=2005569 RepID=UPI000B4BCE73|nr:redoxin domain-containing protein [Lacimicrobium sp. SS2-24]
MSNQYRSEKLPAGSPFPDIQATLPGGQQVKLADISPGYDWKMLVVYRGQHCPMCTRYLRQLEGARAALASIGVDILAISADGEAQLQGHQNELQVSYPIAYGLSPLQMKTLGLYVSEPRSAQETDHVFAEPGLFVINSDGRLQVVDISNNPFVRPDVDTLVNGLKWIKDPSNHYPIRGTHIL